MATPLEHMRACVLTLVPSGLSPWRWTKRCPRSSNTFEIWLEETLKLSHFDHSRNHEDQERRRKRSGAGTEKQVQKEASVYYFQMGTENPVCCSTFDNFSAGRIHLFQCVEICKFRICRSCGSTQVAIGGSCMGAVSLREGSHTTCISAIVHIPHFLALCG